MGGVRRGADDGAPGDRLAVSEEALANVHANLHSLVSKAVSRIAHLETSWSESELTKRIVRYIYNAAKSPDWLSLPWREAAKMLVGKAMDCYCAACQEKDWFYQVDLCQSLVGAAWEVLRASRPRLRHDELKEVVEEAYEVRMDKIMLHKALWDCTKTTFSEDAVRSKVYTALTRTYQPALEECVADARPRSEVQVVEQFTKRWIVSTMDRAWTSVENPQHVFTDRKVASLFQKLIAPYGETSPFSCIPIEIIGKVRRPPPDWGYVRTVVEQLFVRWEQESLMPRASSKKRKSRRAAAPDGEDAVLEDTAMDSLRLPAAAKASRHPRDESPASAETEETVCDGGNATKASRHSYDESRARAPCVAKAEEVGCDGGGAATVSRRSRNEARLGVPCDGGIAAKVLRRSAEPRARASDRVKAEEADDDIAAKVLRRSEESSAGASDRVKAEETDDDCDGERAGDLPDCEGHPLCTSAEDCKGGPGDHLVRHMLADDAEGDVYCEACWETFLEMNPQLEGIWEDGELAGAPYASASEWE